MVNQIILSFINEQKNRGYTAEQLRNSLIQQGYPSEEVNQAINISFGQVTTNNTYTASPKKHKKYWIIIGIIILVLIIGGYFFLNSQKDINSVKGNVNVDEENNSVKVTFSTGDLPKSECILSKDCPEGLECIQDRCTTVEDFYKDHVACCEEGMLIEGVSECDLAKKNTENVVSSCMQFECENCEGGVQSCVISQTNGFFSYCAECLSSFSCKEGFACEFGECVPE